MMQIILISICLSIDALGIGASYALKGVKIGWFSRIMIGFMSALVMYISLITGNICLTFFPDDVMKIIGCSILFLIGITFIKNSFSEEEVGRYDFNHSSRIEWTEAVVLGIALSADAFSAGFAISALEISQKVMPVCVGVMQTGFLFIGALIAEKLYGVKTLNSKVCGVFSGGLLILIAILKSL